MFFFSLVRLCFCFVLFCFFWGGSSRERFQQFERNHENGLKTTTNRNRRKNKAGSKPFEQFNRRETHIYWFKSRRKLRGSWANPSDQSRKAKCPHGCQKWQVHHRRWSNLQGFPFFPLHNLGHPQRPLLRGVEKKQRCLPKKWRSQNSVDHHFSWDGSVVLW